MNEWMDGWNGWNGWTDGVRAQYVCAYLGVTVPCAVDYSSLPPSSLLSLLSHFVLLHCVTPLLSF